MRWLIFDGYGTLFNAGKENILQLSTEIASYYSLNASEFFLNWSRRYFALERKFNEYFMTIIAANEISLRNTFIFFNLPPDAYIKYINKLVKLWSTPKLYSGADELFSTLHTCVDLQIGLISNSDESTISAAIEYTSLPITNLMSSERARYYKPDPRIFEVALKEWGAQPDDCIYVGNSIADITGAKAAHMNCILFNWEHHRLPDAYQDVQQVSTLHELTKMLPELLHIRR